jgi:hypothetical protein
MRNDLLRYARTALRILLVAALTPGAVALVTATPAAAGPTSAPERATYPEALGTARSAGRPVEWLTRRTETAQQFVNPDGSVTLRQHAVPRWVRRGTGWATVDPTLRVGADGSVSPVATVTPLRLSGGGTAPLLTIHDGANALSLHWPTALPKPVLTGDTATYPEVYPGVDLQVRAEVTGYSQVLVVKTPEAARNRALDRIAFRTSAKGLRLQAEPNGFLKAVDGAGATVLVSDGAAMWDSPAPATAQRTGAERAPNKVRGIGVHVTGTELAVTTDRAMLDAPDTVFPVYIDPPLSKTNPVFWTHVNKASPNTSYWTGSSRDAIRVGREWGSSNVWRAHFQFDIAQLKGTIIRFASFHITADHTADCAASPVDLWQTNWIDRNKPYTWYNDSDGDWNTKIQQVKASANESSCPKDDDPIEFGAALLKTRLQSHATNKYSTFTLGLRAPDEGNQYQWKKFVVGSAWLEVTFNRTPNVPTAMAVTDCYLQCASPAVVSTKTPELSVKASDPDGGTLTIKFEVHSTALVWSDQVTGYASGSAAPAKRRVAAGKLGDGWYKWRARACDPTNACSGWTGWFQFTTDTTAPAPPDVAPANPELYFEDDGSGQASGGIGVSGQLVLTGIADVAQFKWSLDGGAYTPVTPTGTTVKTATITVMPRLDMLRTLTVEAYDAAGRKGVQTYRFMVASPTELAGYWQLNEASGTSAADELDLHPATATGGVTRVVGRTADAGYAARFAGTGVFTTAGPVLATSPLVDADGASQPRSFSVSAWVSLAGSTAHRTVVSQPGTNKSVFELQFQANKAFCFSMWATDATTAAITNACAPALPTLNRWYHVAGVYDAIAKTLTLYVNGGIAELGGSRTVVAYTGPTPFAATGPMRIGAGYAGGVAAYWLGDVDDVKVHQWAVPQEDFQMETLAG